MRVVILILLIVVVKIVLESRQTIVDVRRPLGQYRGIPKIIHRTQANRTVRSSMHEYCHQRWAEFNPDFSIIWYTNSACDKFMHRMGPRLYQAYTKLIPGAFKADLWRACILHELGGIYVDSYTTPYCTVRNMLAGCLGPTADKFVSVRDNFGIHNGVIICTPRHPFLTRYIADMLEHIETNFYGRCDLDVTGPGCLAKSITAILGRSNFQPGWNGIDSSTPLYLYRFGWGPYQDVYKKDRKILRKKYSLIELIRQKILGYRTTYTNLWKERQIYID